MIKQFTIIGAFVLAATAAADDILMTSSALEVPPNPVAIAAIDFDSDGRDEVLLFYQYPARYLVLRSDENARLLPAQTVTFAPASIERVRVADVDNDGLEDIVASSSAESVFHVLLNQGDGTFTAAPDSPVPAVQFSGVMCLGDTNKDGLPEILAIYDIDRAAIYPNLGGGRFAAPVVLAFSQPGGRDDIAVSDTRGLPSAAIAIQGGTRTSIFHATGPGPFDYSLFQDLPLPAPGNSIRSADIGSLGRESFVVGGRNAAVLSTVRYDDGLGTYVAELSGGSSGPQENISIVLSSPEHQPRRAVFSFNDTGALRILTNNPLGSGSFEQSTPIPGAFVDLQLVTFADLRGDGNQYVVACNNDRLITIDPGPQADFAQAGLYEPIAYTPSQLVPMPSRQGSYLAAVTGAVGLRIIHVGPDAAGWSIRTAAAVNVVGATNQPRWAVIDINGDGRDDILHIVNVNLNHRVRWQLQLPNGTFQAPVERFVSTTPITNLVASDLNSDAYGDAVVLQANGQASILYGQADGELSEPEPVPLSPFGNPGSLILADLDQDGLIDLACANRSNSSGSAAVHVAYATGPESYAPPVAFSAPTMSGSTTGGMIDAGDLNDDGVLDIALATNNGGAYVLLSNGPRSYQSPLLATVIANLTGIRIVDMGGDGLAELVVSASDRSVILSREDSDLFAKRSEFLHTGPTSRVVIADLDNDALPEVIATASNGAVLVLNRSGESCIADYLPDGALDFFDIAAFLADFNQQVPATDLNRDGNFNFFDVAAFMRAFASNCR